MAKIYEKMNSNGDLRCLGNPKKVTSIGIPSKDGKLRYVAEFETVKCFGKNFVATKGKDGNVFFTDASKCKTVQGYFVTINPKGKDSYIKFIPATDCITLD